MTTDREAMNLPPMPKPTLTYGRDLRHLRPLLGGPTWNESAMRDYGAACYAAGMEEALRLCKQAEDAEREMRGRSLGAEHCTQALQYALASLRAAMPPKP